MPPPAAPLLAGLILLATLAAATAAPEPFGIRVVDAASGRGVPLVELETVNHLLHVTDSAGWVAFNEPGLMDREVFFHVRSHGYEFPKDGFGNAGVRLHTKPGGRTEIKLKRVNIAERLYRITGEGIYRDSVLLGQKPPLRAPVLNAEVLGQDSVQAAVYRGKIHWFWGDTQRARYPLGQFQTSGATSELPSRGGLAPAVGVDLAYFTDPEGFSRRMVPLPEPGMVWIDGLLTVPDETGRERLVAHFARMKSLGERLEHGLVIFEDERAAFARLKALPLSDTWRHPAGQSFRWRDQGRDYIGFASPFATVRVPATLAAVRNPAAYESFTCLAPEGTYWGAETAIERDAQGRPVWGWKANTAPVGQAEELAFIGAGKLKPEEARLQPRDVETRQPVKLHAGSIRWNAWRKRWVMIAVQSPGSSFLGEVWFSEADSPAGPWRWARKIVSHERYSFYNPAQHAFFDEDGGRVIYFEGTYTRDFSGNPVATPRYDYNQIMYRLDLADPRLRLPDPAGK
jgi:hypothetical protein